MSRLRTKLIMDVVVEEAALVFCFKGAAPGPAVDAAGTGVSANTWGS